MYSINDFLAVREPMEVNLENFMYLTELIKSHFFSAESNGPD